MIYSNISSQKYFLSLNTVFKKNISSNNDPMLINDIYDKPVYFEKEKDKDLVSFLINKERFNAMKDQYNQLLDKLVDFCKYNLNKTDRSISNIEIFRKHLFNGYFSDDQKILFSIGKQYMESIIRSINNKEISIDVKIDIIRNFTTNLDICSGGVISALQDAMQSLRYAEGGLAGYLEEIKNKIITASIQRFCQEIHAPYCKKNTRINTIIVMKYIMLIFIEII